MAVLQHFAKETGEMLQAVRVTTGSLPPVSQYVTAPLNDLVGRFQLLRGAERLRIASKLPLAAELKREMNHFTLRSPGVEIDVYEALRAGTSTDLILSLLLGLWTAEMIFPDVPDYAHDEPRGPTNYDFPFERRRDPFGG